MNLITDKQELELFNKPRRNIERSLLPVELLADEQQSYNIADPSLRSTSTVKREIDKLISQQGGQKFRAMFIQVEHNDGMTWSAQYLKDIIEISYPQLKNQLFGIKGFDHVDEPSLVNIVGAKSFYRALRSLKPRNWREKYFLILFTSLTLIKLFSDLQISLSNNETSNVISVIINRPSTVIMIILNVILTLFLHRIGEIWSNSSGEEKELENLKEQGHKETNSFNSSINALAETLDPSTPRLVIVDNYNALDKITRQTFERYLETYDNTRVFEFWVVFYHRDGIASPEQWLLRNLSLPIVKNISTYTQIKISDQQQRKLISLLELPDFAIQYDKIKLICGNTQGKFESIQITLEQYLRKNPKIAKTIHPLEVLYLFSLDTSPGRVYLDKKVFIDILKHKKGILNEFFASTIDSRNLTELIEKVFIDFKQFLRLEKTRKGIRYAFMPELKDAFLNEQFYTQLSLPDHHLGHLFWTFYWADHIREIRDGGWYQRLSHHIFHAGGIWRCPDEHKLKRDMFETILPQTVNGCLASGLFQEVPGLLKELYTHWSELMAAGMENGEKELIKIINIIWRSYQLTTKCEVFDIFNEVNEGRALYRIEFPHSTINTDLYKLFPWGESEVVYPIDSEIDNGAGGAMDNYNFIDFVSVGKAYHDILPNSKLNDFSNEQLVHLKNYLDEFSILDSITQEVVLSKQDHFGEIKLLTLGNTLFCMGLNIKQFGNQWPNSEEEITYRANEPNKFAFLVQQILNLASQVSTKASNNERGNFTQELIYFKQTYVFYFYVNAISSLVLSYWSIYNKTKGQEIAANLIISLNQIINLANETLSFKFPEIKQHKDLIHDELFADELKKLFKLCIITSRSLGAEAIFNMLTFRGNQFFLATDRTKAEKLLKATNAIRKEGNMIGILANLLVTQSQKESADLRSIYIFNALEIANKNKFSKDVCYELLLMLLYSNTSLPYGANVDQLFVELALKDGRLAKSLEIIADGDLEIFSAKICNFLYATDDQSIFSQTTKLILHRILSVKDTESAKKINAMIRSNEIVFMSDNHESLSDIYQILEEWKDSPYYEFHAIVINTLMKNKTFVPEINQAAFKLLSNQALNFHSTTLLYTAGYLYDNCRKLDETGRSTVIKYIKLGLEEWESSLSSGYNIWLYSHLKDAEPQKRIWLEKIRQWEIYQAHVSEIQLLYLMDNRRYFDYVQYCYKILKNFGLETDQPEEHIATMLRVENTAALSYVKDWINAKKNIPGLISEDKEQAVLSGDFIILGHYLFNLPELSSQQYDLYRNALHKAAHRDLNVLLEIIANLSELPTRFKELFLKHNSRFELTLVD